MRCLRRHLCLCLSLIDMSMGIYIHIPFCVKKCNYCDFNSSDKINHLKKPYVDALICEINSSNYDDTVDSVFVGGGTPTSINIQDLTEIIKCIQNKFNLKDAEITVEVNPATINKHGFAMLKNCGVNRISLGLQSADDAELKTLGRIHRYSDFLKSYNNALNVGFDNINVDLMFSLPGQTLEKWQKTLSSVVKLKPQHISCYSLIIEEGTPFYNMDLNLPSEDTDREIYEHTVAFLKANEYNQYEISNFAKRNKECKHNIKYWRCENYIGFGAGASSLYNGVRFNNSVDVSEYIKNNQQHKIVLSDEDKVSEYIFLGLRMNEGIDLKEFYNRFGFDFLERYDNIIEKYVRLNLMEVDTHCRLTLDGFSVSNSIMSEFV